MLARAGRHIRSNVVAYLALFVALGGTSYAAANITSAQIKNGTIQGKDIKDGSVKSPDVGNGSLLAKDFKKGQIPAGAKGATGATGPQGAAGSALGYAHINFDGSIDASRSKNVLKARLYGSGSPGTYCVSFTFAPKNVSATMNGGLAGGRITVFYQPPNQECAPDGTSYQITVSVSDSQGNPASGAFDIVVN